MRKIFLIIFFSFFIANICYGRIVPLSEYGEITAQKPQEGPLEVKEMNFDDFKEFIEERFEKVIPADENNINKNVSYVPSQEALDAQQENEKGFFEKIYDQAIARVSKQEEVSRDDVANQADIVDVEEQNEAWQSPEVPSIVAYLPPNDTAFTIPALEHIPYFMNFIEILPSGLVKFQETVVVVANGQKLKKGLTKILPSRIYDAEGDSKKLDYSIIQVTLNDHPVNYKLSTNNKNVFLVPEDDYVLPTGVHTYRFEYVVDNLLWETSNSYRLYWDIGGNGWNLVVDRLGASLHVPKLGGLVNQQILLGSPQMLQTNAVSVEQNGPTAMAYKALRPLFIGEGMHLIANIDKSVIMSQSLMQKVLRSFYDNGDIYISLLGFSVIVLSFIVSWHYIASNKNSSKISLSKTAMVIRYIYLGCFDIKSVCGFFLELYKKNIIDIQQSGETILLVKRTDNLKKLPLYQQKAIKKLFGTRDTTFSVNANNRLHIKRFAATLERGLKQQMLKFRIKLNSGYLFFSLAMLFLSELFMASFKINAAYTFAVLGITTIICFAASCLWLIETRRWLKIVLRFMSVDVMMLCFVLYCAVINPVAALLLIAAMVAIIVALSVYSKRMGLIKYYIRDMGMLKDHIEKHRDNILLGKDFLNNQAAIWALDLEDKFASYNNNEYNKLNIMKNIVSIFKR